MKTSVILASYIPTPDRLYVGMEILDKLVEYFSDSKIYVGINPSTPFWTELLDSYKEKLDIKYKVTKEDKLINSDASAFQTALKLYRFESDMNDDLVWFIHTKGVTSNCNEFRTELFNLFLKPRMDIEKLFENNKFGVFNPFMYKINGHDNYIENNLRTILIGDNFKINTNLSCLYTWYTMRGSILKDFLNDVDNSFFEKNLITLGVEQNFDRYFFERDFPMIAEKYGYGYLNVDDCDKWRTKNR